MSNTELEEKWKKLSPETGNAIRISADCIPDLFIGVDSDQSRCAILKLPQKYNFSLGAVVRENLALEHFETSGWLVLKLLNSVFQDLFNDLVISLYTKVRYTNDARIYSQDFIDTFYKWSEFFRESNISRMSDQALLGLIGELVYLREETYRSTTFSINQILSSWQGPYDRGHDFILPNCNVEVKTKWSTAVDVQISSEFQLEPEKSKPLYLAVVNVSDRPPGVALSNILEDIKKAVIERLGDFTIILTALSRKGLSPSNISDYDSYRLTPECIEVYNCMHPEFPKLSLSQLPHTIHSVKYSLRINMLNNFITERTILHGSQGVP